MPEMTKEELNEELNKILGTSIDFMKLSKDDLTTLRGTLLKFKEAQEFPLPLLNRPLGEILDKKIFDKPLRETSLAEIIGLPKDRRGIFGLGLIPRILREAAAEEK